jgi:subtilisin family serine protease
MPKQKQFFKLALTILNLGFTIPGLAETPALIRPIVAVIDTGADIEHSMLSQQIWTNPGEQGRDSADHDKASNQIDDDGNGYIDDVHGWNFLANNNDIRDQMGHGTHIAGIIASKSALVTGGRAPAQLMILKFFDVGASGDKVMHATAEAIDYATKMGASIINYSAGGRTSSAKEFEALIRARTAKVLVITAAGNEHSDIDKLSFYPASYRLSNIIAVSATDDNGRLLPSSNYGKISVQARALGKDIWSSLPGEKMGKMTGTSQATAMMTAKILYEYAKKQREETLTLSKKISKYKNSHSQPSNLPGNQQARTQASVLSQGIREPLSFLSENRIKLCR